jgi:hypothetical protein
MRLINDGLEQGMVVAFMADAASMDHAANRKVGFAVASR